MTTKKQHSTSPKEGWIIPGLLIFGAFILTGFLANERPIGWGLLAVVIIGGAIALLVKRDWQDKVFDPIGVNDPVKRYVVLGMTLMFMLGSVRKLILLSDSGSVV
ncbi:MAG: hypothetical protein JKY95_17705 [Planctomycetaceae bacterium]|nr:hypothetical protein [Planctomycetaceae bacterium]MBL4886351.1 hypothetical protein [Planctomycetaceae bacterium]